MNAFNRFVVILSLLAAMVVLTVVLVAPRQAIRALEQTLYNLDGYLVLAHPFFLSLIGAILAGLVNIICILLLWLQIRRPRPRAIKVQGVSGGEAMLTLDSVARRLEYHIDRLTEVISVKSTIISRRRGVEVLLDLETSPEIDVPAKTEEVCQVTRELVEDKMGLKLHNVKVNIKQAPYPEEIPESPPPIASVDIPLEGI